MGLILVAKGEDFSAIAVDRLPITTVTGGLLGLFETRKNSAFSVKNLGSDGNGTIFGAPVFSTASISCDETRGIDFGIMPTGTHTIAAIFKIRADNDTTFPAGNIRDNAATRGAEYFSVSNSVKFEATNFDAAGAYKSNASTTLAKPAAGNVEMYIARAENGVRLRLDQPRTGASNAVTVAAGNTFNYPNPYNYSAGSIFSAAGGFDDFYVFAYWNRSLSDVEITTFYGEVQAHLAKRGVTI